MQKTSVAIILHGLSRTGINMLMATLARYWDYSKLDVTYFLAVDPCNKQQMEDEVTAAGARVIHLHDLDHCRWLRWPVTISKALKEFGPFDVAHYNMNFFNGINAWASWRTGVPVRICHAHSASHQKAEKTGRRIYESVMRRMMVRNSTILLGCSGMAGRYYYHDTAFHVIPNGIDLRQFTPDCEKKEQKPRFITVGRLHEDKNPFFLLDVFRHLIRLIPEATLDWAGNGPLENDIKAKIRETELESKVHMLGSRQDVNELLKQSSYFLFPSRYEGLGIALIEAQAAGLDCFISDTIPEEADCGKCMRISLKKSAEEWASEIAEFVLSGRSMNVDPDKLGHYNITSTAQALMNIYCGQSGKEMGF